MMHYRAILVDDEYWALEILKRIFPWAQYGFEVEAAFMDAGEALRYIREHPVDLVVTDIRMPGFSGLDLLHEYRAGGGEAEFVITSGYSEFEYARTALHENAFDYCLKPIKAQEAESVLARVREACARRWEQRDRSAMETLEEKDGCARAFAMQGVRPEHGFMLCAMALEREPDMRGLQEEMQNVQHISLGAGRDKWLYLFCGEASALERLDAALERLCSAPDGPRMGVSRIVPVEQTGAAWLHEADMAALGGFVDRERRFERFDARVSTAMSALVRAFSLAVGSRDVQMVRQVVQGVPALLCREGLGVFQAQNLYNRLVTGAQNLLGESGALEVRGYEELVQGYASVEQVFQELAQNVCALMDTAATPAAPGSDSFYQLLEYVRENYAQKLSIKALADRFYMNPTYLCELFKRKTGHTFNEYVTALRMQSAGERIRAGEYSLQEIAYQVGYNDYFYFSKAFKKYHALSPSAYAEKNQPQV